MANPSDKVLLDEILGDYHAIVIEGPGSSDNRDPAEVSHRLVQLLNKHWAESHNSKNDEGKRGKKVVITQGDPASDKGIAAITKLVAEKLGVHRFLVAFDDYHAKNADHSGVTHEIRYEQLCASLGEEAVSCAVSKIDDLVREKNCERAKLGEVELKDYVRCYAMLQEVTKAALRQICRGGITIAHTTSTIDPFSVTSFYEVDLSLDYIHKEDMVQYYDDDQTALPTTDKHCTVLKIDLLQSLLPMATTVPAKKSVEITAEGQAQWLQAYWFPPQIRKNSDITFKLQGQSNIQITCKNTPREDNMPKQLSEEHWISQINAVLKKIEVQDLGNLDAPSLLNSIPDQDSDGRGIINLREMEKQLSIKVVFCDNGHVLLVGQKTKLQKKCFVVRNMLSHYYWRLSGKDVKF